MFNSFEIALQQRRALQDERLIVQAMDDENVPAEDRDERAEELRAELRSS